MKFASSRSSESSDPGERGRVLLLVLISALTLLAWRHRFIQDDAFISFRYARNLVEGRGLVWNPGEPVEGYSNFLWTLLMAAGIRCGIDPVAFSWLVGLALFPLTLWSTHRLAQRLFGPGPIPLLAVVLVGTNFTFSSYATGGLETQLQTALAMLAALQATAFLGAAGAGDPRPGAGGRIGDPVEVAGEIAVVARRALLLSLTAGAAMLTRLDSALLLAAPFTIAGWSILRGSVPPGRLTGAGPMGRAGTPGREAAGGIGERTGQPPDREVHLRARALGLLVCLLGPAVLLLAVWSAWKIRFYGDLLPNTFYLKAAGAASFARGAYYVVLFFLCYGLAPFPIAWMLGPRRILRTIGARPLLLLAPTAVLWIMYVIEIGGDFMEFRLFVPILPILMIAIAWTIVVLLRRPLVRAMACAVVLGGSLVHAWTFDGSWRERGLASIPALERQLDAPGQDWVRIGRVLASELPPDAGVTIALTPAGAIPYYSRLRAIDMLGVNDRWVARHGALRGERPGHRRIATVEYLRARDVNLVLAAYPVPRADLPRPGGRLDPGVLETMFALGPIPDPESLPPSVPILALPIGSDRVLPCLYLTRAPALDELIERNGWSVYRAFPPRRNAPASSAAPPSPSRFAPLSD